VIKITLHRTPDVIKRKVTRVT